MTNAAPILVPYPLRGLNENWSFHDPVPATTRSVKNMRPYDHTTGRLRGGQRMGMSKWLNAQVNGDSSDVQDLAYIIKTQSKITYTEGTPTKKWAAQISTYANSVGTIDEDGNLYVSSGDAFESGGVGLNQSIVKINESSVIQWTKQIAEGENRIDWIKIRRVELETFIYVNITVGQFGPNQEVPGYILKFRETANGIEEVWRIGMVDYTFIGPIAGQFEFPVWYADVRDDVIATIAGTSTDGIALHYFKDEGDRVVHQWSEGNLANEVYHDGPLTIAEDGSVYVCGALPNLQISKWSAGGAVGWPLPLILSSGNMWAMKTGPDMSLYFFRNLNSSIQVLKYTDNGPSATQDWTKRPVAGEKLTPRTRECMAIDTEGNAYVTGEVEGQTTHKLVKLAVADGTIDWTYSIENNKIGTSPILNNATGIPDGETVPRYVYLTTHRPSLASLNNVYKLQQLTPAVATGSTRIVEVLGVANGNIKKATTVASPYEPTAWSTISVGTAANSIGGDSALSATSQLIHHARAYNKLFFVDGINYVYYDTQLGEVITWLPTSGGRLPEGCRLVSRWRGRVVLSGTPLEPHNWFMAAYADPFDFNYFPVVPVPSQAVAGNNSDAGEVPDIINALIPYSDDLLIFGCDHSIHRLTGDPMEGGRIDAVSEVVGMAFGTAWDKDDEGAIYFFGSKGGVYRWAPGGQPLSLTRNKVDKTLRDINVGTTKILLRWDQREQGLHVYLTPFAEGSAVHTHYFWDRRTDEWGLDEHQNDHGPTVATLVDGDHPNDRVLLLGGFDGYVRKGDPDAEDDDGTAIDSNVLIGPIVPFGEGIESTLVGLKAILGESSGGVRFEVYADSDPLAVGQVKVEGDIDQGDNKLVRMSVRGTFYYIKLLDLDQAWQFERLRLYFEPKDQLPRKR